MKFHFEAHYDFIRKEICITFENAQQAQRYQNCNREGRIHQDDDKSVWIPFPSGLKALRADANGLVFCFRDPTTTTNWCNRIIMAKKYTNDQEDRAYIVQNWEVNEWERTFPQQGEGNSTTPQPPAPNTSKLPEKERGGKANKEKQKAT